ncbi:hypothetical protein ACP70R_037321 [Stipagrostis hirtigluma subsp. patula]
MEGERSLPLRSRSAAVDASMDVLCDTLMVEEVLPRLLPKSLICLGAVSRRYHALTLRPDFAARYWPRAGVFLQPIGIYEELRPRFLTGSVSREPSTESFSGADLSFLPGPSAREKDYLRRVGAQSGIVLMHSTAGLLLCSRGRIHPVHFYVCNPVTWQWVALPELPWPSHQWQSGLLTVDTKGDGAVERFKVVLFNHPIHWRDEGGCFDLRLFSSDTGLWEIMRLQPPVPTGVGLYLTLLGQSGTVYWSQYTLNGHTLAYNSENHTFRFIPLPDRGADGQWNWIIGEDKRGGLRFARSNSSVLEVWNTQKESGDGMWMLVQRVSIAELLERNPQVDAFLCCKLQKDYDALINRNQCLKLLSFHPTNDDIIFLRMPGALASCSVKHGTMNLQCTYKSSSEPSDSDMYPYVHPSYQVKIPAIKNSNPASVKLNHS